MKSSKLINHWANMCESGQGTTMVEDIRTKGTMVIDLRANFMDIRWPPNTLRKYLQVLYVSKSHPLHPRTSSPSLSRTPLAAQNKPPKLLMP